MGQSSIPMLNKVGYSMFWGSMWDSKALYSRNLKEDLFFNKFFDLIFNDNVSSNIIKFNKKKKDYLSSFQIEIDEKNESLYKYLINANKMNIIPAKVWILKYQKWIIIYKFIYIHDFNKKLEINKNVFNFGDNFFYIYKFYKKSYLDVNYKFNLFKKHAVNNNFTF